MPPVVKAWNCCWLLCLVAAVSIAASMAINPAPTLLEVLQQDHCKPAIPGIPSLSQADCFSCMETVAGSTATESLLGCHDICQSKTTFQHFDPVEYGPALACASCMAAPGTAASACATCLRVFSKDAAAAQNCLHCVMGNKHGSTSSRFAKGCVACARLGDLDSVNDCSACMSIGDASYETCAAPSQEQPVTLVATFIGATAVSSSAVLTALSALSLGNWTLDAALSSLNVTAHYQFASHVDALSVKEALRDSLEGQLSFFNAIASACQDCQILVSGERPGKGLFLSCDNATGLSAPGGWTAVVVPALCSSPTAARRLLLTTNTAGLYTYIDESWQFMSFKTYSTENPGCTGVYTGCNAALGERQNLISAVCMWGGWYVDAVQFKWTNGQVVQAGVPNAGSTDSSGAWTGGSCLYIAVSQGEVITNINVEGGGWMDGMAVITNFGSTLTMGCTKNQCPGNSDNMQWKYRAAPAAPAAIKQAQSYIDAGAWSKSAAYASALGGTTSSGYLCGINVCSGNYVNNIAFYFMLPVMSMKASPTQTVTVGQTSTATYASHFQSASGVCPSSGVTAGTITVLVNTEASSSSSVTNTYSTSYSKTISNSWQATPPDIPAGQSNPQPPEASDDALVPEWMFFDPNDPTTWAAPLIKAKVSSQYSGSVKTSETSSESASTTSSTKATSGSSSSVQASLVCPQGPPANALCNWTFYGYTKIDWTPTAWTSSASYTLLGGGTFTATLGGQNTGSLSTASMQLVSIWCNGRNYLKNSTGQ